MVESDVPKHDETIVPVKLGLRATLAEPSAPAGPPRGALPLPAVVIGAAILLVAAAVGFVWLPNWVEASRADATARSAAPVAAAPVEPERPPLSPEEAAALRAQAESLLAGLLTQQDRLEAQSVASWGGDDWHRYGELIRAGDDALLADDPALAVERYTEAERLGEALAVRGAQTVDGALAAAAAAFSAGNAELAIQQYDLVLGIDPTHAEALAGRARAERLPEVLAIVQRADAERAAGELEAALASYRAAVAIDPGWQTARTAIAEVAAEIERAAFDRAVSAGFRELTAENFAEAAEHFRRALELEPRSDVARDGLAQAEQGAKLERIALTEARALAFERRELWDQAIAQYKAVLEIDPTLAFAQIGLERAQARAGLDAKLANLIANPTLLFGDTVLADSRSLLEEARAIDDKGPRLETQINDLDRLVTLATTPIPVRLESDRLTDVTLYRVGALGVFAEKQVELRPGTYTVIGSRDGYRDVRRTFTVVPGRELPPISVVCVEPI